MTRRHGPEEYAGDFPLLAFAERAEKDAARRRGHAAADAAASKAERVEPGWKAEALEVLRLYASEHAEFLAESVPFKIPSDADPRAAGQVIQRARRLGWIKPVGYGSATSSNGSPKTRWASLLWRSA